MHSTTRLTTDAPPGLDQSTVCGRFLKHPDLTGKRRAEGGLRLHDIFKRSMSIAPLVTVITTVRNAARTIERCMTSVFDQTYANIEYIVIDGLSTDNTLQKIEKYGDRIDYYLSEPDTGLYHGMNKGLGLASGDYVLMLNADDWYADYAVARLVGTKQATKADLVCARAVEADRSGKPVRLIPSFPFKANVKMRMPLRHETMLISKELYNIAGGYDESYRIIADLKLTAKLYTLIDTFHEIQEPLLFFRNYGIASSLTQKFIIERERLLEEHFAFLSPTARRRLAVEYDGNIAVYAELLDKYDKEAAFVESLMCFLSINNALGTLQQYRNSIV